MRSGPGPDSPAPTRRFLLCLAALVGIAFALRAAHLASVLSSPLGDTLVEDARFYHREALRILDHGPTSGVSFMNLGYPYALAAIYFIFGRSVGAALMAQALLGALTCALVALTARRLARSDTTALLAGGLYAAYAGAIFYDGLLLTPSLTNLALAASLLAMAVHLDGGRPFAAACAGGSLSLAILLRANTALLVPAFLMLVILTRTRPGSRARARSAMALLAASLFIPLLVIARNGLAHGDWAPVSANGGVNFWIGNNRQAEGVYHAADFLRSQTAEGERLGFLAEARRRTGDYGMSISAASSFWLREGWKDIRENPGRWLTIEGRKAALFWNAYEAKTNVGMEFLSEFSPVLSWTPVRFSAIAVLGIGGLVLLLALGDSSSAWLLGSYVLVPFITCLAFFVSGEYRHPASLALPIGAALLLERAIGAIRGIARDGVPLFSSVRFSPLGPGLIAAGLFVPLVLWPFPPLRLDCHPHLDFANYARQLAATRPDGVSTSRENVAKAVRLLEIPHAPAGDDLILLDARLWVQTWGSVELADPALARQAFATARVLLGRDLRPDPERYSESTIRQISAAIPDCMTEIAEQGFAQAEPELRREADLLGAHGYSEFNRRFAKQDFAGALAFLDEALERAPHHVGLEAAKGQVLLALGRDTEGLAWLERSCDGWPEIADCAVLAAERYEARGDTPRAASAAREALRRDPRSLRARELLSRLEGAPRNDH